jgi:hypothetical protein
VSSGTILATSPLFDVAVPALSRNNLEMEFLPSGPTWENYMFTVNYQGNETICKTFNDKLRYQALTPSLSLSQH